MKNNTPTDHISSKFDTVLKHADAPELTTLLRFLEEDLFVATVAHEMFKSGNYNASTIPVVIENLLFGFNYRFAQNGERGEDYRLIEWLEFWFGEGAGHSQLQRTGVFFDESDNYLNQVTQYVNDYQSKKITIPTERLQYIADKVKELDQAIETGNRKGVQNFIDEFAATYVLDENGNFKRGADGEIKVRDKYDVRSELYSKKNKEIVKQYNEGVLKDREQLVEMLKDTVFENIENLNDYIYADRPVELPREVLDISESKQAENAFVSLRHLITELEYICEATLKKLYDAGVNPKMVEEKREEALRDKRKLQKEKQEKKLPSSAKESYEPGVSAVTPQDTKKDQSPSEPLYIDSETRRLLDKKRESERKIEELKKENRQLREESGEMDATLIQLAELIESDKKQLGRLFETKGFLENLQARQQSGETLSQDELAQLQNFQPVVSEIEKYQLRLYKSEEQRSALENNFQETQKGIKVLSNQEDIKDHELKIKDLDEELANHSENLSSYLIHAKKLERYKLKLDRAESELEVYETIFSILSNKNLFSMEESEFGRAIAQANLLLKQRDKLVADTSKEELVPIKKFEDEIDLAYEEGAPEWKLLPDNDIVLLRDQFVEGLENYKNNYNSTIDAHQKVIKVINESAKKLSEKYKESHNKISRTLGRLINKGQFVPEIIEGAQNIAGSLNRFSRRQDVINAFRDALSQYKGFDGDEIRNLIDAGGDGRAKRLINYVADAINDLYKYVITLEKDSEATNALQEYGITRKDIIESLEELKNVGRESDQNPYGTQKTFDMLNKLRNIPHNERVSILPATSEIDSFQDFLTNIKMAVREIKSNSEKSLTSMTEGINTLVGSIKNVISQEFIDLEKIEELLIDARKVDGLKNIFSDDHIKAYTRTIKENTLVRDITIKQSVREGIMETVKEFQQTLTDAINAMKKEREKILTLMFGDYGSIYEMRLREYDLDKALKALDSDIANAQESLTFAGMSEQDKAWYENILATAKKNKEIKSTELQKLQEQTQEAREKYSTPLELHLVVEKALSPQKGEIIKVLGDRRKDYDFEEGRSIWDLAAGVTTTRETKRAPSSVPVDERNWYSIIRVWKSLVDQCNRSLAGAGGAKKATGNTYAAKLTELSPSHTPGILSPVQSELNSYLLKLKKESDPKTQATLKRKVETLKGIQKKITKSPKEVVIDQIHRLKSKSEDPTKITDQEGLTRYILYLRGLLDKLETDSDSVTQEERSNIENFRFSPTELRMIERAKRTWVGTGAGMLFEDFAELLQEKLPQLYQEKEKLKQKGMGPASGTADREAYLRLNKEIHEIESMIAQGAKKKGIRNITDVEVAQYHDVLLGRLSEFDHKIRTLEDKFKLGKGTKEDEQEHMQLKRQSAELWKPFFKIKYFPKGLTVDDILFLTRALAEQNTQEPLKEEARFKEKETKTREQKLPLKQLTRENVTNNLMNAVKPYFIDKIELFEDYLNKKTELSGEQVSFLETHFDEMEEILQTDLADVNVASQLQTARVKEIANLYNDLKDLFEEEKEETE